jgi:ubiquitin carboxyl-terminal hydrolase 22/27/51
MNYHLINNFIKQKQQKKGKFSEWEPSQSILSLLDTFTFNENNKTSLNNNNILQAFMLKNESIIGLRGLLNLGNTCFMNCILQAFSHTPMLRDYFLSDQHVCLLKNNNLKRTCIVCELVIIFQEFYSGNRVPYVPYHLLHQVWTQVKHLAGYEQQDAHEFFIAALNAIHKNCIENDLACVTLNANPVKVVNFNNCNCIIDKIFTGGLQSDVICSFCDHISTKVDPFWDISLDIGPNNGDDKAVPLSLEDCLYRFTLPETLSSFNCSFCKSKSKSNKQLRMNKLPIVCCFHLKRFEHTNKTHKKISTHIYFPELLEMSPYMANKSGENNNNNNSKKDDLSKK